MQYKHSAAHDSCTRLHLSKNFLKGEGSLSRKDHDDEDMKQPMTPMNDTEKSCTWTYLRRVIVEIGLWVVAIAAENMSSRNDCYSPY